MMGKDGSDELARAERDVSRARVEFTQRSRMVSRVGERTLTRAWQHARPLVLGAVVVGGLFSMAALVAATSLRRRKKLMFVIRVEPAGAGPARRRAWASLAFAVARVFGGLVLRRLVQTRPVDSGSARGHLRPSAAYTAE
jgi:hypothetical protein